MLGFCYGLGYRQARKLAILKFSRCFVLWVTLLVTLVRGYHLVPYFDQSLVVLEAENFTLPPSDNSEGPKWSPRAWGHGDGGFFAATTANTFHSRRGYLTAPPDVGPEDKVRSTFTIPAGGTGVYSVLARYEHGYRFSAAFSVTIFPTSSANLSAEAVLFHREYGWRGNLKVWAFAAARNGPDGYVPNKKTGGSMCGNKGRYGGGLQAECMWPYGATENIVWEGVGATVPLKPGTYTMVIAGLDKSSPGAESGERGGTQEEQLFCQRNIDAVVLHPNISDVDMRVANEGPLLPLDGLLNQAGDVFFKVENLDTENWLNLTIPYTYMHSPYFTMHLVFPVCTKTAATNSTPGKEHCSSGCNKNGGPRCPVIRVPPGSTSDWVDVGASMDAFNHGTWNLASGQYVLQVGVPKAATPDPTTTVAGRAAKWDDAEIDVIGNFVAPNDKYNLQLVFDANTRGTRRIRHQSADFWELKAALDHQTKVAAAATGAAASAYIGTRAGASPMPMQHVPVYGDFFSATMPGGGGSSSPVCPKCGDEYTKAQVEVADMFGIITYSQAGSPADPDNNKSYIDLRSCIKSADAMQACLDKVENKNGVYIVSLGDEIGISGGNTSNAAFDIWCKAQEQDRLILFQEQIQRQGPRRANSMPPATAINSSVGCGGGFTVNTSLVAARGTLQSNGNYYWSNRFVQASGVQRYAALTKQIQAALPNAETGANFPPQIYLTDPRDGQQYCLSYLGTAFQFVDFFRGGGMSMPWSEDWTWQAPVASQQVVGLMVDALRAGVTEYAEFDKADPYPYQSERRYDATPKPMEVYGSAPEHGTRPILMYTMAHSPSNHPINWRRNVFTHLMHGTKILDLFDFKTSISGYTCDYVDQDTGMYESVRAAFSEISTFDDIVKDGVVEAAGAKVALLYSASSDLWLSPVGTQGTAKRTLYLLLKHLSLPLDILTESDLEMGHLNHYAVLYVVDAQVSESAMRAVAQWVQTGGEVMLTAGAAMLNEYNMTNTATRIGLLRGAVEQTGVYAGKRAPCNSTIYYGKQDLPYAELLDTVNVKEQAAGPDANFGIYGEKSVFSFNSSALGTATRPGFSVIAQFSSDNSPAIVNISSGKGSVLYFAFHPGLSYFFPALPKRPVDRTPVLSGYTNFVPTAMDTHVRELVGRTVVGVPHAIPVQISNPLVEVGLHTRQGNDQILNCWNGSVLILVDWSTTGSGVGVTAVTPNKFVYTRVNVSLSDLPLQGRCRADSKRQTTSSHLVYEHSPRVIPFKTANLASCMSQLSGHGCRRVLPPFSPGNPTNTTVLGWSRFNISADKTSFSVDLLISDAIVMR